MEGPLAYPYSDIDSEISRDPLDVDSGLYHDHDTSHIPDFTPEADSGARV